MLVLPLKCTKNSNTSLLSSCYFSSSNLYAMCVWSVVFDSLQPHGVTVAHQNPLSMEFSRQEYWSGLPFPTPGGLPDLGIKPMSLIVSCIDRQILYHQRHLGSTYLHISYKLIHRSSNSLWPLDTFSLSI